MWILCPLWQSPQELKDMCNSTALQQKIAELTNDGEVILRFLTETVQAKTPGVKIHHQLEASRQLTRLGNLTPSPSTGEGRDGGDAPVRPEPVEGPFPSRHSRAEPAPSEGRGGNPEGQGEDGINTPSPSMGEGRDGGDTTARTQPANEPADAQYRPTDNSELTTQDSQPTYLDILNYNLAQLIRSETAEGHTITEFLLETVTGRDSAFTPNKFKIKPDDRMTAAREVINRGFGRFGRRRKLIDDAEEANDYDTLHSDLAKRLRQYSEQGSQAILFLLDVMRNDFPEEQYTRRHRVSAAQELMRRGWDTNYDKIKQEDLLAYWRDQQDARLSVGQKKQLAGLHTFADEYDQYDDKDYETIAKELYEQEKQEESPTTTSLPPQGEGWEGGKNPIHPVNPVSPGHPVHPEDSPELAERPVEGPTADRHSRKEPAPSEGKNSTTPTRHSREACPRPRSGSGNPEEKGKDGINTPSPSTGEGRDGGEYPIHPVSPTKNSQLNTQYSQLTTHNSELTTQDSPDCYYEPLNPEDQALFDYQTLIDSGEYKEGEIEIQPPSEATHQEYAATLKWMRQAAAAEGIPLLPNPLSGTFKHPNARSP